VTEAIAKSPSRKSPSKKPKDVRERERQVTEMLRMGLDLDTIAEQLGYADHSAIVRIRDRVCKRHTIENLEEVRAIEIDRLDGLMQAVWPKAIKGDMWAVDRVLSIMERRSKYLGLDHSDGIMERQTAIAEQQAQLLLVIVKAAIGKVELTQEQTSAVMAAIAVEARALGAG
jgi:hypothetical protein